MTHDEKTIHRIVNRRLKNDTINIGECMKEYAEFMLIVERSKVQVFHNYESTRT